MFDGTEAAIRPEWWRAGGPWEPAKKGREHHRDKTVEET